MLGLLLLAIAAFLWVNFLVRGPGLDIGLLRAASGDTPADAQASPAQPTVAPVPESQVARELEILELPFLVTEPPAQADTAEEADQAADDEAARAGGARRATVNPFSPVIPAGGATAAAQAERPAARNGATRNGAVTEVPVPDGPQASSAAAPAPKAPAPAPVTPGSQASGTLPRALPGGTLGGTPQLLRSAIGATDVPVGNAGRQAAVREPEQEDTQLQQAGEASPTRSEPQPLTRPVSSTAQAGRTGREATQPPLAAGTSALSRYLRDNNVRFTGSVIGPVSVGVFRSSLTSAPVVISLGQALPDTSIVLTDLRGQQAQLGLGDSTQTLTLELRR